MILYCTLNRGTELWYLDLVGQLARPPVAPAVYALVSFEGARPSFYVGCSRRLTARLGAHFAFSRSVKLRGNSAGGRLLAPVVARRRRALVLVLETCPGADSSQLLRREQAWLLAAIRDNGGAAVPLQLPAITPDPTRGPAAPATLAARRRWPTDQVAALAGFFREPRRGLAASAAPASAGAAQRARTSRPGPAQRPAGEDQR